MDDLQANLALLKEDFSSLKAAERAPSPWESHAEGHSVRLLRHSTAQEEDLQDFLLRYKQLQSLFEQLDQRLSQNVASVLTRVTRETARLQGYGLVLRKEDALYLDGSQLEDLSPQVRERLPELFGP